jgi:hypothetical protein
MGKGLKKVGKVATGVGLMTGSGPLAKALGLEEKQGDFTNYSDLRSFLEKGSPETEGVKGTEIATEQVQKNPILGTLFGKGGAMERTGAEEARLASQGFQLTPEDREAYGQASGDIARMFGQQEQDAAKALARRGLGSAGSGAAGAMFSGLAGNKNEMLAKQQMQIANQRMQNTMQRLGQTRTFLQNLGQQAGGAIQDQFGRQQTGRNQRISELSQLEGAREAALQGKNAAYQEGGLLKSFGRGLQTGVGTLGAQLPGMAAGGIGGIPSGGMFGSAQAGANQSSLVAQPRPTMSGQGYKNYGGYA